MEKVSFQKKKVKKKNNVNMLKMEKCLDKKEKLKKKKKSKM